MSSVRYPNFDTLRIVAASSVVFSHAFLIATGSEETEPLHGTGLIAGVYGVFVFFILSGFLVTESAKRSAGLADYFRKRFLRIAPALVVSTLLITYVICPPFALDGATAFVLDPKVMSVAMQAIFLHSDGLYFSNIGFYPPPDGADYLPGIANGVLWTIRLEVIGYALIALLMAMSLFKGSRQIIATLIAFGLIGFSVAYGKVVSIEWVAALLFVLPSFCCGIIMNWLVQFHKPRGWLAALFALGFIPAVHFQILPETFCYIAAYPLIWIGAADFKAFGWFNTRSDISYGVYLYGWPVTQVIRAMVGDGLSGYEMAALALPVTALIAYLSWHLVEKPALRLKTATPKPAYRAA
ncbi:acyltransferase [Chelativorans sp. M5D2P16]|uniref:acyltransferase family protein n=1 Tax=Chelativorans sp. M5D2P16 TaxID=3095678 RepID=UPI002ACAA47F|nr:acyltransferase [Chelativorans sp. M5D2P16]MDZ5699459.1 acyltransferase [Chelativorans sp. M5D2P16]